MNEDEDEPMDEDQDHEDFIFTTGNSKNSKVESTKEYELDEYNSFLELFAALKEDYTQPGILTNKLQKRLCRQAKDLKSHLEKHWERYTDCLNTLRESLPSEYRKQHFDIISQLE